MAGIKITRKVIDCPVKKVVARPFHFISSIKNKFAFDETKQIASGCYSNIHLIRIVCEFCVDSRGNKY